MDLFKVGHYRILSKLGSGGTAEVFLAEDTRLRRKVALKLLHRHLLQDAQKVARFQQEAQWACVLNHPNILTIFEIGEEDGVHFIATEHVEGQTLRQRIAQGLPLLEVLEIAASVASALVAAHEAWIVHRDIKPENVMLRPDGYVKVLDFGMAKLTQDSGSTPHRVKTEPRIIIGTIQYMAPEQLRGQGVDPRTDLFSLGVLIHEMVSGRPPFRGESWVEFFTSILEEEPLPLAGRDGESVPRELVDIVSKALRKDPAERHQSALEMMRELRELRRELEFRELDRRRSQK